jgi:short-subunit dehydrogenase involved in D-alanine esterification of teichoic acids
VSTSSAWDWSSVNSTWQSSSIGPISGWMRTLWSSKRFATSIVELEPPAVRTSLLPGQEDNGVAMPLDEFIAEATALLEAQPDAKEIQVERVKFLRYGEARGDYDQVVATLNRSDPHGR